MRGQVARALLDHVATDQTLKLERLHDSRDRRIVALTFGFERSRDSGRATVDTIDRWRQTILNRAAHEEDAFLLRSAWPLVHRAGEEIGLNHGEIQKDQA